MIEEFHRFGTEQFNSISYPVDKYTVEEAKIACKEKYPDYIYKGTFAEYYPIEYTGTWGWKLSIMIKKDYHKAKHPFVLKSNDVRHYNRIYGSKGIGYHSSQLNNNVSAGITRQQLLELVNSMEDSDVLAIIVPDTYNTKYFENSYCKIEKL